MVAAARNMEVGSFPSFPVLGFPQTAKSIIWTDIERAEGNLSENEVLLHGKSSPDWEGGCLFGAPQNVHRLLVSAPVSDRGTIDASVSGHAASVLAGTLEMWACYTFHLHKVSRVILPVGF